MFIAFETFHKNPKLPRVPKTEKEVTDNQKPCTTKLDECITRQITNVTLKTVLVQAPSINVHFRSLATLMN